MKNYFVISGAPGSGKTALVRELMASGFAGVPEPAREVLSEQRAVDGRGVPEVDPTLFCKLMLSRAIQDFRRMRGTARPIFFDRGIPDLVGYADFFGLDSSAEATAANIHRYGDVVFVTPSWPQIYATDDERRMSFEAAHAFGERVREVYAWLGYTIVDVPRETPARRAAFVARAVEKLRV